jgi:phosphoglucomutase
MPTSDAPPLSAEAREHLLPSTQKNLERVIGDPAVTDRDRASVAELLEKKAWTELDDRFFRDIAFGTGGMRGPPSGRS